MMTALIIGIFAACSNPEETTSKPAGSSAAESSTAALEGDAASELEPAGSATGRVGFVTFGLGGDFFQQLADAYVAKMESLGWEVDYTDGNFDPTAQIEACENYIAMGVDVLVVWSVAPEAMTNVANQAREAGIKFVSFVAPTEVYDVLMVADNAVLAEGCARLAAKWIDENFTDSEDNSVPVAVYTDRTAETGVVQGDVLLKIEEYSQKAKFVVEVECSGEDVNTGVTNTETLYTSNPDIKVFLTAHNGLALGINNYFTSISSPVTDYSDMGIFTINGDDAIAELIQSSVGNASPMRGMVLTGSVEKTAEEIASAIIGTMDGSIAAGTVIQADNTFVNAETVDEYLANGDVTSLTIDDLK